MSVKKIWVKAGTLPVRLVLHVSGRLIPGRVVVIRWLDERRTINCLVVEKVGPAAGTNDGRPLWILSRI